MEDQQLPTDLTVDEGTSEPCKYQVAGCNVRLPVWRKLVHENLCIYKDKLETVDQIQESFEVLTFDNEDPDEMVSCKFSQHGCMVMMPRHRKSMHESKCNYLKYHRAEDDKKVRFYVAESVEDPDEYVSCRWADYGCQVQPRRCRKYGHEEKCNYRRVPCRYNDAGCYEMVEPSRKHLHESTCNYS